ncbi:hypothetical protein [Chitinophaga solisilvae]|uniref:hypothetical protein n=1 Tax=Chitinophaga solisilvae TaxID=1233460 RepID=UPI001367FF5C|nr:hypothetical protein [Chitinophaga solisilvae]
MNLSNKWQHITSIFTHEQRLYVTVNDQLQTLDGSGFSMVLEAPVIAVRSMLNGIYYQTIDDTILRKLGASQEFSVPGCTVGLAAVLPADNRMLATAAKGMNRHESWWLSPELQPQGTSKRFYNRALPGGLFFFSGRTLNCYDENELPRWEHTPENLHVTGIFKPGKGIDSYADLLFIATDSAEMIALRLDDGQPVWRKQEAGGKFTRYENNIYSLFHHLEETDARTGETLRTTSLEYLDKQYKFYPSNEMMIYDDYILLQGTSEAMVAVLDRSTFELKDIIRTDEMIPYGKTNLIRLDNRIYLLDYAGTLYEFEL